MNIVAGYRTIVIGDYHKHLNAVLAGTGFTIVLVDRVGYSQPGFAVEIFDNGKTVGNWRPALGTSLKNACSKLRNLPELRRLMKPYQVLATDLPNYSMDWRTTSLEVYLKLSQVRLTFVYPDNQPYRICSWGRNNRLYANESDFIASLGRVSDIDPLVFSCLKAKFEANILRN